MTQSAYDKLSMDLFIFYHTSRIGRLLPSIFYFLFMFFVRLFCASSNFESWSCTFQDPATIYALALIDLHDFTM